uniref:Uncharacterized protein n=1 Tax=Ditylenchus dipsaci TaxID=166011 RepID=A0A915E5J1_9BILA
MEAHGNQTLPVIVNSTCNENDTTKEFECTKKCNIPTDPFVHLLHSKLCAEKEEFNQHSACFYGEALEVGLNLSIMTFVLTSSQQCQLLQLSSGMINHKCERSDLWLAFWEPCWDRRTSLLETSLAVHNLTLPADPNGGIAIKNGHQSLFLSMIIVLVEFCVCVS